MRTFRLLGLVLITMLVSINFAACSDGNEQDDLDPDKNSTITIDSSIITNGLAFAAEGSIKSVSFTTNTDWTLNIASTTGGSIWCMASVVSGKKGEASVEFTTLDNSDYDDRSVSVTIKAGTASQTFTIIQKCKEAILVTTDKFEIVQEGGSINVEVKSNIDYQMEISETAKSWITETNTRALTTHNHTFSIAANEEYEKREGEIYFKKGEYVETVKVYQAGGAVIVLTKEKYEVSDKGETITVEIKSNVEYGIKMPQVDWIYDEASVRGASSHTLKYIINPNETYDSRSAQIIYFDKDNTASADTLTIIQVQKDAIVIGNNEYTIDAKGKTIEVELSSNIDYTISIADDGKDWISCVENTRALTTKKIKFNIAENTSDDSRASHITFASGNGVSQNIKIIQQGALPVIHVETAGTLSRLINSSVKDEITKLKITGNLNSTDTEFLRKMEKIQVLDLSEVNMTKLGYYSFQLCNNLTSIIIPSSVTSIGEGAFWECSRLTSVVMPDGVTSIGKYAFGGCSRLTSIAIPDKVITLSSNAFQFCTELTSIDVGEDNTEYSSIDGALYDKNASTLLKCPEGKISIAIPGNMANIGDIAFYLCSRLTSINVDENNAKYLSIDGALYDKNASTLIKCPEDIPSITIPNSVTSIGDGSLSRLNLTSITIPNSVINIGDRALSSSNFTSITIPNSVTSLGNGAFDNCSYLTSITLPNSVTTIGNETFAGCSGLTSITIPNSVTSIGIEAFSCCRRLTSITIPGGVTSIGMEAFSWCSGLTSITISKGVTKIGINAFWGCSSLTSVTIPNSVTSIGKGAFSACYGLTSITIPNSVTSIGDYAFWGCSRIREIHIGYKSVSGMNPSVFENVDTSVCVLYVPRGCKNAYSIADGWRFFKNIVEE